MQRLRRIGLILTLVGLFLPTFVFAQSQPADGRLLVLRVLQIIFSMGVVVCAGLAVRSFLLLKKNADDLIIAAQEKKKMLLFGIFAAASLVCLILFSIVYWIIDSGNQKNQKNQQAVDQGQLASSLENDYGEYEKIASFFPSSNQRNIPRNVSVLVTFKESINPMSLVDEKKTLKKDSVLIRRVDGKSPGVEASVEVGQKNTSIKITPTQLLGDPNARILYEVSITQKLQRADGRPLLDKEFKWQFEVSGFVDTTPPFVEQVLPATGAKGIAAANPPNALIQATFSEALDPMSIGQLSLQVLDEDTGSSVPGSLSLSNNYKTVTFVPAQECGKNSCGEPMYCLPQKSKLKVLAKAASLQKDDARQVAVPKAIFPYDGIADVAGNSLDGGGELGVSRDSKSQGSPADDFITHLVTGDQIELSEPAVYSINPGRDMTRISLEKPVDIVFSKIMDAQTLNMGNIRLAPATAYSLSMKHDLSARRTVIQMNHDPFKENTLYSPEVTSGVKDMYQNCLSKCIGPTK